MRIGYGRVSTRDQSPDGQHDALGGAGCDKVFVDKASGKLASRPKLDKALRISRKGDQLVVTKLDRLLRPHAGSARSSWRTARLCTASCGRHTRCETRRR